MKQHTSRRSFLRSAASAAAATGLAARASWAAGATRRAGANERLSLGVIGCGQRGPYDGFVVQLAPGIDWVAVCDVHRGRLGKSVEFAEGVVKHAVQPYHDYRRMLDDKHIQLVVVATSIHWHALVCIDACAAGKDVYLEKPLGLSIGEGQATVEAVQRHRRIVQMGTQQHSWEHYIKAVDIIRSGRLGEISSVHVWDVGNQHPGFGSPPDEAPPSELDWGFYVGPSPMVSYNLNRFLYHDWYFGFGGGWQLSWGAHHYDIVHWAMDTPGPISATASGLNCAGLNDNREWPDTYAAACEYAPGPVAKNGFLLTYTARAGSDQPIFGSRHGKAFHGSNATLVIDRLGWTIYPQLRDGKPLVPEEKMPSPRKEHEVVIDHARNFVDCVRARRRPAADIEVGHRATNPGHLMNIAWKLGRKIRWDPQTERVIDDPQAQAMVTRSYREPWRLPR